MKNTDPNQDAQNLGKIEKTIEDLLAQGKDTLTEDLEEKVGVELRQQMKEAKQEISKNIQDDSVNAIYQNKSPGGIPLTLEEQKKKNIKDRSIRQTQPTDLTEEKPDTIYKREDQKTPSAQYGKDQPEDMFENLEDTAAEEEPSESNQKKQPKAKKNKPASDTSAAKKETTEGTSQDKTPEWQSAPVGAGGMERADTGDISQKKPEEKKSAPQQEQQNSQELRRQRRKELRKKYKQDQAKQRAEMEKQESERKAEEKIGKMSVIAFICWIVLAIMCDIFSVIPYIGLIASWPFAAIFGIYKWRIGIKKTQAAATTAMDFIFEGFLSTLPVSTLDVIVTFILSNSTRARTALKKIKPKTPAK